MYFGVKHISRTDAWGEWPWGDAFCQEVFSKDRFNALYACWHFVDNQKTPDTHKKANAFWQAWPLITVLQQAFMKYFESGQYVSIDEMTTPFKGRSRAKQYNPSKPNKWGFKDFAICCAMTGFCMMFYPYQGKDASRDASMSLAEFAVRQVLLERFWSNGCVLAIDNWFMCWGVVQFCLDKSVHLVGTLRAGRAGFPSSAQLTFPSSAARGSLKVFRHPQKSVFVCSWQDKKAVRLVSTFDFGIGTCERSQREGGWKKILVDQPQLLGCYNLAMGGCDLSDQLKAYIRPVIRSRVPTHAASWLSQMCLRVFVGLVS